MVTAENWVFVISMVLLFCMACSRYMQRFGIPLLVFFIGAGMLLGSDGVGGIYFDDPVVASKVGNFALCFILFAGGLGTNWKTARQVLAPGAVLSTVGVVLTAVLAGLFATLIFRMGILEGMLLGAVLAGTDAASVFSILRSSDLNLKGTMAPLVELESGSNDPMAYMLTIGLIGIITAPSTGLGTFFYTFAAQITIGTVLGFLLGKASVWVLNHIQLNCQGLYPVAAVALMAIVYSSISMIDGNGFLGVYVAGLVMGNSILAQKGVVLRFFDGLSWLMQVFLFVTLGLLVFPSRLPGVVAQGMLFACCLFFIVRPAVVIPLLHFFKYPMKSRVMVSWVGFRGASSIVFATYPLVAGLGVSNTIFNVVFFVAMLSVLLQGTTLAPLARYLDQLEQEDKDLVSRSFTDYADDIWGTLCQIEVAKGSFADGKSISQVGFPGDMLVVMVKDSKDWAIPNGSTELSAGYTLVISGGNAESRRELRSKFGSGYSCV